MEFGHVTGASSAFVRNIPPTCGIRPIELPNFRHHSRGSHSFTRASTRDVASPSGIRTAPVHAFALLYPAINAVEHGSVLKIPTFGVPCPTTIFAAGLLLLATPRTKVLAIVPIVWSAIGGSAAFLLGVSADYALLLAGAALTVFELQRRETSSRALPSLHSPVGR